MSERFQRWLQWLEERFHPPAEEIDLLQRAAKVEGAVRIVADSSCDLAPETVAQYSIVLVSLIVRFGETTFRESEISREQFWQRAAGPFPPQTSQPPVGAFEEAFSSLTQAGAAVLCITITGHHSGTYNAARVAAQQFSGRVLVWDSRCLSVGMGLQVREAAALAQAGCPLWEIVQRIDEMRRQTRMTILLDTIEYLRRGGRLGRMIGALEGLARFLSIRPLLRMAAGELGVLGAARSYRRGLARLRAEALAVGPLSHLGVAHSRRPEEAAALAQQIANEAGLPPETVLITEAGPTLSSHAGPGAVGVATVSRPDD